MTSRYYFVLFYFLFLFHFILCYLLIFNRGQTALHKAVQNKDHSICYMLIAAGSTLIIRDKIGKTPRDYAVEMGEKSLAIYLQSEYILYFIFYK